MTRGAAAAAVVAWLATAPAARAQPLPRDTTTTDDLGEDPDAIGVLEVETYGVSETAGDKFEESVEETLADVGRRVERSAAVKKKLADSEYVIGCTFGPCIREVEKATGLSRVLVARIQGEGQTYSVVVSLIDTATGYLVAQVAQSCPVCTVDEAISTATLAVVELVNEKAPETAVPGGTRVVVERPAPPDSGERAVRRVRRTGWVLLAGGLVGVAAGAWLWRDDQRDTGGPILGGGAGLAVAGVTALVLSATF
jgi:hypothetical protein